MAHVHVPALNPAHVDIQRLEMAERPDDPEQLDDAHHVVHAVHNEGPDRKLGNQYVVVRRVVAKVHADVRERFEILETAGEGIMDKRNVVVLQVVVGRDHEPMDHVGKMRSLCD